MKYDITMISHGNLHYSFDTTGCSYQSFVRQPNAQSEMLKNKDFSSIFRKVKSLKQITSLI